MWEWCLPFFRGKICSHEKHYKFIRCVCQISHANKRGQNWAQLCTDGTEIVMRNTFHTIPVSHAYALERAIYFVVENLFHRCEDIERKKPRLTNARANTTNRRAAYNTTTTTATQPQALQAIYWLNNFGEGVQLLTHISVDAARYIPLYICCRRHFAAQDGRGWLCACAEISCCEPKLSECSLAGEASFLPRKMFPLFLFDDDDFEIRRRIRWTILF